MQTPFNLRAWITISLFVLFASTAFGRVPPPVQALTPSCGGTNDTSTFNTIISSFGSDTGTIHLPFISGSRCAVNNLTIPANITLDNSVGTGIKVNTGQTLTVVGPVVSPPKLLFANAQSGQGTVSFAGNNVQKTVYPEWWGGGVGVAASTNAAAFNAASAAVVTMSAGDIKFGSGQYDFNATFVLGSSGGFTGVGLVGTNGLVGTILNWTGSTSGDAIKVTNGRFNKLWDFILQNSALENDVVTKGTTRGIVLTGPTGGATTFFVDVDRITVRGFDEGFNNGDSQNIGYDADLTMIKHSSFESNNIGLRLSGYNSTRIDLFDVSLESNATYGAYFTHAPVVNWNGGSFGGNGISIRSVVSSQVVIRGIRDEVDTANQSYRFYKGEFITETLTIENCSWAGRTADLLTNPLIIAAGPVTLRGNNFGGANRFIPFGGKPTTGDDLEGPWTSLIFEGNTVNENVPIFQYRTNSSGADGLTYLIKNNIENADDGSRVGPIPNEEGRVVWPDKISYTTSSAGISGPSYTPAQITANQNNYKPLNPNTATAIPAPLYLRLTTDASRNITGLTFLAPQIDGQTVYVINAGSFDIVLKHEDGSSTAANRFRNTTGADITLTAGQQAMLIYDAAATGSAVALNRWRVSKM